MGSPAALPPVHCLYGTRRGAIASIVFNFGGEQALRTEIMERLKRVAEESGFFGEVTIRYLGQEQAVAELQRPWRDKRFIDSPVKALAADKFELTFDGVLDEGALEDSLRAIIGAFLLPPPNPN